MNLLLAKLYGDDEKSVYFITSRASKLRLPARFTRSKTDGRSLPMCRWIAYTGPEIFLEDLLFDQEYSIASQSLDARESVFRTNADGFGVAWYAKRSTPGLFKDILPAWNDSNLRSIAAQIEAGLFFAHVRASTGTSVTRTNCHPFTFKNWAFMHNGKIGNWTTCRKSVEQMISPAFYSARQGTTDSEAMFLLALSLGLEQDPPGALMAMLARVREVMDEQAATEPLRVSLAVTDGSSIWALRCSSDDQSPSLYYGCPVTRASKQSDQALCTIASEPLDSDASHWLKVEEGVGIHWSKQQITEFRARI
ncbi:MAG: class II glutamine amidotransferase [Proteobacteria bacterium]|nr:class II glutamine amidotransferase [Pseudomonadota bacterium]